MSTDFVVISKLSFSWLALQVRVDCTGLRSIYLPDYYPRMLVNSVAWIDLYVIAATTFELTVLNLDGVCLCKLLIPLKCNLRIKVQMCQKQQRGDGMQCKKQEQILIQRVFRRFFQISEEFGFKILPSKAYNSEDVYLTKNSSQNALLAIQLCTYTDFSKHLDKSLMAFQEQNGNFLKVNDIYSYIAQQLWKNLISVPPPSPLHYYCARIAISKDYLIAKIIL